MRKPRLFCADAISPMYQCTNIKQIHHLSKVLRVKTGSVLELFDGRGALAHGEVQNVSRNIINIEISYRTQITNPYAKKYHAILPYIKKDILLLAVQKLVELGVNSLFLFKPELIDQSLIKKDLTKLHEKIEDAVIYACEQSGCNFLPKIEYMESLPDAIDFFVSEFDSSELFVLDTITDKLTNQVSKQEAMEVGFITGPETGFSDSERLAMDKHNFKRLILSHYVLRAETAPLASLAKLHDLFGEFA